ncbi:MAG: OmpA family protein [Gammaproteobacteria bacterium]|nr:OmpA family protein [Gammaproteobacteria bacterium]
MQSSSKTKLVVAVAAAVALLGMNPAMADKGGKANAGYVGDNTGHLVKDSLGKCVKNSAWTPALALDECGDKAPAKAVEKISLKADAHFDFDKSDLKAGDKKELDDAAAKLKSMKIESITITGHTDNVGTDAYNQKLSERRAEAVKKYLVGKGVSAGQMQTQGKGESQPVADNKTADGRAKNRRVDIEFKAAK